MEQIPIFDFPFSVEPGKAVAVAVSGGPDSMALLFLMMRWAREREVTLHVLSVDHGLRPEAGDEIALVRDYVADAVGVTHHVLTVAEDLSGARVQESARLSRYALMAEKCLGLGVLALCLAHHQDDQGETVLFRLAKGSGLDGLCAMRAISDYSDDLKLVRPLLDWSKESLVALCEAEHVPYVQDPSNEDARYARVRLRAVREALEAEGVSNKRLALTAKRLQRAHGALEYYAHKAFVDHVDVSGDGFAVDVQAMKSQPEEIVFRVFLKAVKDMRSGVAYNPRMEKLESLFADLWDRDADFKRTLGGLVFEWDHVRGILHITREKS